MHAACEFSSAAGNGVFVGRKGYLTCCVAAKSTVTTVPLSKNFCITARCFCRRSSKTPPLNIFIKHAALFIPCHDLYRKDWNALNVTWRLMWHVFNATRYLLFFSEDMFLNSVMNWCGDASCLWHFSLLTPGMLGSMRRGWRKNGSTVACGIGQWCTVRHCGCARSAATFNTPCETLHDYTETSLPDS